MLVFRAANVQGVFYEVYADSEVAAIELLHKRGGLIKAETFQTFLFGAWRTVH